jgi:hypothetical protein
MGGDLRAHHAGAEHGHGSDHTLILARGCLC